LELPAPTRVIGVVPPPGKDKLAKQKTQAAQAAASRKYAEGASGADVQSLTYLTSAESRPNATAGVGGPYVPVPETTGSVRPAASRPKQGAAGLYAHLSSQRSETDARFAFRSLQQKYPDILSGRDAVIRRSDDANQGTFYRVEVGPFDRGQADEFCNRLKSSGGQCVPQYE
jgi:hypothetical protein